MELIPETGIFSSGQTMAKQLLALENMSLSSGLPPSGFAAKKVSSLHESTDCETIVVTMNREDDNYLVLLNGTKQERRDGLTELNGSERTSTEGSSDLATDSKSISLRLLDKNGSLCGSTQTFEHTDLVLDILPVGGNRHEMIVDDLNTVISGHIVEFSDVRKMSKFNIPLWGFISIQGRMKEMEDSAGVFPWFLNIPSQMLTDDPRLSSTDQDLPGHVFGVYDGHGGSQVSNYCKERMHFVLAEEISNSKQNLIGKFGGHNMTEQWSRVFLDCFHKLDGEVGGFPRGDVAPIGPENVGSTAVVAVVSREYIIVANCGDSRAVLCRGKVATPLSVDHKPDREDECTRIETAGGMVFYWEGFRVSGILAMSRSIGDRYLKPYVIADPEVTVVPRAAEDECLILASDGLWDVMSNQEACDLARRRILRWHRENGPFRSQDGGCESDPASQDAAYFLSEIALQRGSRDNISVIVIDLKVARRKVKKAVDAC